MVREKEVGRICGKRERRWGEHVVREKEDGRTSGQREGRWGTYSMVTYTVLYNVHAVGCPPWG